MPWIQIIDDDHWCGEAIIAFLIDEVPNARFDNKAAPEADDGRDVYIVDNEFEDGDHGIDLVRSIRRRNPDATIVLCTATHDRIDARTAMNAGCNALIEKGSTPGREELREIVRRHVETRAAATAESKWRAVLGDVKSIISAWNARMNYEDGRLSVA
ncbi:MAG: response regulator [Planctomycetota bacterium]